MLKLIQHGGFTMYPILLFGAVALATAAWFAYRAEGRVRGFLNAMALAILFASFAAQAAGLKKTLFAAAAAQPGLKEVIIMRGLGESLSAYVLGGAFLALTYLLTAIGQRRLDGRRA
jgi:thiol:disulfide interchange protein